MRHSLKRWLLLCLSSLWAQRAGFLYALWDLDFEAAEREITFEWNGSYITWDQHRIAFFKALFPQHPSEKEAFWNLTTLYERQFERQIAPTLPELVADAYAQRAILYVLDKNWVNAGLAAWKSWRFLQKAQEKDPLTHQWRGLWQVVFATLPSTYSRWLPGDVTLRWEAAQAALRKASAPGSYTTWESSLLYFFILRNLDTLASPWLDTCRQRLFSQRPPPYLWRFALALYATEEGEFFQAETLLQALIRSPKVRRFPYPYYWLGKLYLYQGRGAEAEKLWKEFVLHQIGSMGLAAQYAWRGYIAWQRGDSAEARSLWRAALSYDGPLWEEDALGQAWAKTWLEDPPDATESRLWAARWLIQGKNYTQARDTLEELRLNRHRLTGDQRTALYYTFGRLYHRSGNEEAARFAYYQATREVAQKNRWMQAYAALYLAQLYEKSADWHNARLYYQEAQRLGEALGRSGVVQKALAGYIRVREKKYPVPGEASRR
ncbi:MAG: hypothetical protein KatS3mg025_0571 [Bacteroidia bacterium]|jgi:tetratricopeptide (TPR) repeat protein|nr:MAG: hypothetical protein KatS3mg025_0571 [Bacteroidia bacterium]